MSRWIVTRGVPVDDSWWVSWDRLNRDNFGAHPALGSAVVRCLAEFFPPATIAAAVLDADDRFSAQLLLEREGAGRWRVFCPAQSPVATVVFDRSSVGSASSLRGLLAAVPGLGLAVTIPYQDPKFSCLASADDPSLHRQILGTTVAIDATSAFEPYWTERPKELRDSVRRRQRMLAESGEALRVDCIEQPTLIGAAVDRYAELENRGWKGQEGTALQPDNTQGRFYRRLLETLAATSSAAVWELYIADQLAASRLVISGPTMDIILKTTFNEDMRRFSPGHLLLVEMLKRIMGRGHGRTVELYTKATREWLMWGTQQRDMDTVTVYRHRLIAALAAWRRRRAGGTPAGSASDAGPEHKPAAPADSRG